MHMHVHMACCVFLYTCRYNSNDYCLLPVGIMSDQGSTAAALLAAAAATQDVGLEGGGEGVSGAAADMSQVLSGLQTATGSLGSVLHTQTPVFSEGGFKV